jgi:hypothetical protein
MLRAARHAYRYNMHFLKRGQEPGSINTHTQPAPAQPASQHTLMCSSSSCWPRGASGGASAACCHQIRPILGQIPHGTPWGRAATQASHLRHPPRAGHHPRHSSSQRPAKPAQQLLAAVPACQLRPGCPCKPRSPQHDEGAAVLRCPLPSSSGPTSLHPYEGCSLNTWTT